MICVLDRSLKQLLQFLSQQPPLAFVAAFGDNRIYKISKKDYQQKRLLFIISIPSLNMHLQFSEGRFKRR